ncbi:YegP family protein [Utexia brackfieldae]|uniref:YegP family protein n=1 Tax=Utexia brackfieldae TaxID=3074108 RepID=UPI00370D9768
MSGKFELFKSPKNNQFYFHLQASNGEIILQSEGYTTKSNCLNGIRAVKKNASLERAYVVQPKHFNLKSVDNGKIIASSEKYSTNSARDAGIASVKAHAITSDIVDLTKLKNKN